MRKFTKPGATVFDPSPGTGSRAKACRFERIDRKMIGCEAESRCMELMTPSQFRLFAA